MADAYSVSTGSIVQGLVKGLSNHFGGVDIMYVVGNPDGKVTPAPEYTKSGGVIAYDKTNYIYYQHINAGSSWIQLGSVANP
jgi:hypothetical protein